jgi:ACT domain-containing protein
MMVQPVTNLQKIQLHGYPERTNRIMKKIIITVVGKDTVGIIAKVCTYLAEHKVNILDISQTIVGGYFNMMMVTDPSASEIGAGQMSDDLTALGEGMGLSIRVMGEDIFNAMHRV